MASRGSRAAISMPGLCLLLSLASSAYGACPVVTANLTLYGDLVTPQCSNFTKNSSFDPQCLPATMRNYTFLSGMGKGKEPFVYNTWMFAEACGLRMTAWRAVNQLPRRQVMFKAAESILMNWGVYAAATIVASLVMNVFYIAPKRKRCCGLFAERTDPKDGGGGVFTYQTCTSFMYLFIMVPVALMTISACIYQFVQELIQHHRAVETLMTPVC